MLALAGDPWTFLLRGLQCLLPSLLPQPLTEPRLGGGGQLWSGKGADSAWTPGGAAWQPQPEVGWMEACGMNVANPMYSLVRRDMSL